jgi:hypothetical protein
MQIISRCASARQTRGGPPEHVSTILARAVTRILHRARRSRQQPDRQQAILDALTDDEFADVLGPSWTDLRGAAEGVPAPAPEHPLPWIPDSAFNPAITVPTSTGGRDAAA